MRLTTKADLVIKMAVNSKTFTRPKSFGAHDTMCGLVDWACTKLALFNNTPDNLMLEFGKVFDQIKYEEAEQTYDTEQYVKIVRGTPGDKKNPGAKVKTAEDIMNIMSLNLLMSDNWAHDNCIKVKPRTATISQHTQLYNYIVDKFAVGNFSLSDLNKIADMGMICDINTVIKEASQVIDIDKRSVAYLYAIIRSVASREETVKARSNVQDQINARRTLQLVEFSTAALEKEKFISDADSPNKWEIERTFAEVLRDLNKK